MDDDNYLKMTDFGRCFYINLPEEMAWWQSSRMEFRRISQINDSMKNRNDFKKNVILSYYVDSNLPL